MCKHPPHSASRRHVGGFVMKVCSVDRLPNGIEVCHYQRQVEYLVRQIDAYEDGSKSYLVKSPCGKLYEFRMTKMSEQDLITFVQEGNAEREEFESNFDSIFDENCRGI